jgi:salicylate hydroxylase
VAGKPVTLDEVRRGFEHVHPLIRRVIESGVDWKLWVLCDRDPVLTWTDGPVALLGDAAHPMLQYFAQGACMAMEDAVCLAAELDGAGEDLPGALRRYEQQRRLRTARVQLQSRAIGEHVYHPEGAHAALRNEIMGKRSPEEWYRIVAWLYGSTGLRGAVA